MALAVGEHVAPALLERVARVRFDPRARGRVRGRIGSVRAGIRLGIRGVLGILVVHEIDVALDLEVHGVVVEVAGFGVERVILVLFVVLYELPVARILGSFAEPGVLGFVASSSSSSSSESSSPRSSSSFSAATVSAAGSASGSRGRRPRRIRQRLHRRRARGARSVTCRARSEISVGVAFSTKKEQPRFFRERSDQLFRVAGAVSSSQ